MTVLGYYLGRIDFVHDHIEMILLAIVLVSVLPIVVELLRARSRNRDPGFDGSSEREQVVRDRIAPED